MHTVVLDSYALLAYFEKEPGWQHVTDHLTASATDEARLLLSVVNWGEIDYITRRVYGEDKANQALTVIDDLPIEVRNVNREHARAAAHIKARGGLSYADCFAAGLAAHFDGAVLTGDPEFNRIEDEIEIMWLDEV